MYIRLYTILIIFITSVQLAASVEPHVTIDSITGRAEVKRAGQQEWILVNKNSDLYNNDLLRVGPKSLVKLKWENGSTLYIHQNSQICINLHRDTIHNIFSHYATVFFGAVYFIIKETLPRAAVKKIETNVYTPTAVIAIRGTSFSVSVDKNSGNSKVGVINGTVVVKNILKNEGIILSAGYQTSVTINNDPLVPSALLNDDISALQSWVPPQVILNEMQAQIAKAKRDYSVITGKLEDKILVLPFKNESSYNGKWDIENTFASLISESLTKNNRFQCSTLTKIEPDIDIVALARKNNARFIIRGAVTQLTIVQRAEVTASAEKYKESCIATVCIHFELIDIQDQKLLYENDICSEIPGKNKNENNWQAISSLTFSMEDKKFKTSILGQAIDQILEQSSIDIGRYLGL